MRKLLIGVVLVVLFSLVVIAGDVGDSCTYEVNGDTECNPDNNIVCSAGTCVEYDGPSCSKDGKTVSYVSRDEWYGAIMQGTADDHCIRVLSFSNGNPSGYQFIDECTEADVSAGKCYLYAPVCDGDAVDYQNYEQCDYGCSNDECTAAPCLDNDQDGYQDVTCGGDDCDDNNAQVNPGMIEDTAYPERCTDGIDNDCDGDVDSDDTGCPEQEPTCNPSTSYFCSDDFIQVMKNETYENCSSYVSVHLVCMPDQKCSDGTCITFDWCSDGVKNRDEDNVDCGGAYCDPCSTGETPYCEDDDPNQDIYVRGKLGAGYFENDSFNEEVLYDVCIDVNLEAENCSGYRCKVKQYFCDDSSRGFDSRETACENGCENGTCLRPYQPDFTTNCSDGVQNCNMECYNFATTEECCETGVDCGGPCDPCEEDPCSNNVQDANEQGIDCGDVCNKPCEEEDPCNNGIQDANEQGIDCGDVCNKPCEEEECVARIVCSYTAVYGNTQETYEVDCPFSSLDECARYGYQNCVEEPCEEDTCRNGILDCDYDCYFMDYAAAFDYSECCEEGVDCGGPCPPCEPEDTCEDGVQNCNMECYSRASTEECCETGVDCGGPCPECDDCVNVIICAYQPQQTLTHLSDYSYDETAVICPYSTLDECYEHGYYECVQEVRCDDDDNCFNNIQDCDMDCYANIPTTTAYFDTSECCEEGVDCGGPCEEPCGPCYDDPQICRDGEYACDTVLGGVYFCFNGRWSDIDYYDYQYYCGCYGRQGICEEGDVLCDDNYAVGRNCVDNYWGQPTTAVYNEYCVGTREDGTASGDGTEEQTGESGTTFLLNKTPATGGTLKTKPTKKLIGAGNSKRIIREVIEKTITEKCKWPWWLIALVIAIILSAFGFGWKIGFVKGKVLKLKK